MTTQVEATVFLATEWAQLVVPGEVTIAGIELQSANSLEFLVAFGEEPAVDSVNVWTVRTGKSLAVDGSTDVWIRGKDATVTVQALYDITEAP